MDPWDDWVYFLTSYHMNPSKMVGKYISPHGIFFIKLGEFSVVKLILGFLFTNIYYDYIHGMIHGFCGVIAILTPVSWFIRPINRVKSPNLLTYQLPFLPPRVG